MKIHQKKQDYINSEIFNFVELLQNSTEPTTTKKKYTGSITLKDSLDLSEYLVSAPTIISEKNGEKTISKKECLDSDCIGLNEINYTKFLKFLKNIHKDKNFKDIVSFEFLERISFKYIIDIKKNNKAQNSFSNYLMDNIEAEIKEYRIQFKMLYLEIIKPFKIGNVHFSYVDENFFKNDNKEKLFEQYKGEVFVSYLIKAEKNKAKEKALKKCALAVDCLKLCFDTIAYPKLKTSLDIDSRTTENLSNEILVFDSQDPNGINIEKFRKPSNQNINDKTWTIISNRGLNLFHSFLLAIDKKSELSELESLICNSIQLFSYSISISNLNRRIVELFTLLESLLLPNSNVPILDSLTKYLSKLSTKDINERKKIIALLKEMYVIRSSYVHHASNKEFDTDKLGEFQILILGLILKLIILRKDHQTKETILEEIDEAILGAY
ncbi:hypothetical protein [Wenyingzhuangia sp. IMCC45467]